ncbi:MAG: lysophospholipid acyltransferase family protein [bacterium]|nr:lysophospholipid acyltransferase family protein [bacterium]
MSRIRKSIELTGLRCLAQLFRSLPRNISLSCGATLGSLVFRLGIRRQVTLDNLSFAFPGIAPKDQYLLAKRCYRHFGALMVEFARLSDLNSKNVQNLVEIAGLEVLDEALQKGKGGIVASGHLGNWELMGAAAAVLGYPVAYVVTHQENELVEDYMDQLRSGAGIRIIKREHALKGVLGALRDNNLIAILSDQDAHEAGAFVPFFGRLASTPRGAATFALRAGAALIFAESFRRGADRLKVIFELIPMEGLPPDPEAAIVEVTRRITTRLEEAVRRHPEQWFWMHRRWKTPPP